MGVAPNRFFAEFRGHVVNAVRAEAVAGVRRALCTS
jgi:hypothetical protein